MTLPNSDKPDGLIRSDRDGPPASTVHAPVPASPSFVEVRLEEAATPSLIAHTPVFKYADHLPTGRSRSSPAAMASPSAATPSAAGPDWPPSGRSR